MARALVNYESDHPDEVVEFIDGTFKPRWQGKVGAVRALLTAMREPTEVMRNAGVAACGGDGSVLDGYEAMIEAALAETL